MDLFSVNGAQKVAYGDADKEASDLSSYSYVSVKNSSRTLYSRSIIYEYVQYLLISDVKRRLQTVFAGPCGVLACVVRPFKHFSSTRILDKTICTAKAPPVNLPGTGGSFNK